MSGAVVAARAPGKLFLTGEWVVLRGAPAVVAAVDRLAKVSVAVADGPGPLVVDSRAEGRERIGGSADGPLPGGDAGAVLAALRAARARAPRLAGRGVAARVDSGAFLHGTAKLGLGRSAATLTAATVALLAAAGAHDPVAAFATAVAAHALFQGGRGSGADVAAAFHGGVIEVTRGEAGLRVAPRALPAGLHLVVGWTGAGAATPPLLARFDATGESAVLGELAAVAREAAAAVARGDAAALCRAVDASCALLDALGREAGIPIVTPALACLVAAARRAGAVAKPSGAGGGDCGIALAESAAQAAAVRAAWEAEGIVPLALAIASEGVRHEVGGAVARQVPLG